MSLKGAGIARIALRAALVSATAAAGSSAAAQTSLPAFSFTVDEFRRLLDDKIREDSLDKNHVSDNTIKTYRKNGSIYNCNFNDISFQRSVLEFKKLNFVNGRFDLKLRLDIESNNKKIVCISVQGDRNDFVNLTEWVSTVVNVMQMFDPMAGKAEGQMLAISKELGFMRGDDASDIGQVISAIKPYTEINCLSLPSHVTTRVECQFLPRS